MDFGTLILSHLVGDYILQNDKFANHKQDNSWYGTWMCTWHCVLYTVSVLVLLYFGYGIVWPIWAYALVFATHWPVDRYGLAKKWMRNVSGQRDFADYMSPWSIIIVDNTAHLLSLFAIWRMVHYFGETP